MRYDQDSRTRYVLRAHGAAPENGRSTQTPNNVQAHGMALPVYMRHSSRTGTFFWYFGILSFSYTSDPCYEKGR